jgi:DNA gyrase/topoisomerase IV subunit A
MIRHSTIDDLNKIIPGPDFPTGGIISAAPGIRTAYHTGRGSIVMRGKVSIEPTRKDREAIIVSEVPYQVNKATMVERSPNWCATRRSKAFPICATNPTATVFASSSS